MRGTSPHRSPPIRKDGLQISEHLRFQNAYWYAERLGWAGFVIIICLALLGFSGGGGLFEEARISTHQAEVRYTRMARWQTPAGIFLTLPKGSGETVTVALQDRYGAHFTLGGTIPQPSQVEAANGWHIYHFTASGERPVRIVFDLTARKPGHATYDIIVDGRRHSLSTWVWP